MLALLVAHAFAQPSVDVVTVNTPLVIDGVMDEAAWSRAQVISDFRRFLPTAGGPPPGRTEVRILQDAKNLYVGVRVSEVDYRIRARISPREQINADDQVGIYLDTYRDEQTGYIFYFNALGVQQDIRISPGGGGFAWNTVFDSAGHVTDDGFVLEVALPFRSIKYPDHQGPQTWGLMLTRKVPQEGAKYGFPLLTRNAPRLFAEAAMLRGVRPSPSGSGLELVPTLTGVQQWTRTDRRAPLRWGGVEPWQAALRPGMDLRYGVTPNVSLTAAVNPDFSQVEDDVTPIDVNQRFAFRFNERRPFFLDGAGFLADPGATLYTRSIGAPIAGLKVTGKQGPWSVGMLQVLDAAPVASFNENSTPGFSEQDVSDREATSAVFRVRKDAWGTGSAGVSIADKRILGTRQAPGAQGVYHGLGGDFDLPLGGRWFLDGLHQQSVSGDSDEGGLSWGHNSQGRLFRRSGQGTGFDLRGGQRSAGYRQEVGFMPQAGLWNVSASLDHTFEPAPSWLDTWVPWVVVRVNQERNGDSIRQLEQRQRVVIGGIHQLGASAAVQRTRDAGVEIDTWRLRANYAAEISRWLTVAPSAEMAEVLDYERFVPASFSRVGGELTLRPSAGIRLDLLGSRELLQPQGEALEQATLLRGRLAWQFSLPLGVRLIVEHADTSDAAPLLTSSLLTTWLLHPDTAVYLGYTEVADLGGAPRALSRVVFAKGSVLLR